MDLNIEQHLPPDFADNSRLWIYQSSRLFTMSEAFELEEMFSDFISNWNSHGIPVKGFANLFFGRFIILMADETATGVSGCSTDSSVRLIKEIEQKMKVSLFDRQNLAFIVKDKVEYIPFSQFSYAIENNFIDPFTLYFNNTVLTKKQLLEDWITPINRSWLAKQLPQNQELK